MYRGLNAQGTRTRRKREGRSACSRMAAALSRKGQWREFLRELVLANQSTLTQRQAFAALREKFGDDVSVGDRAWCKTTVLDIFKRVEAEKIYAQNVRRGTGNPVLLSSSSESEDDELVFRRGGVEAAVVKGEKAAAEKAAAEAVAAQKAAAEKASG